MITVTLDGQAYELQSLDAALSSLTGDESLMLEDYLGGFANLGSHLTKTAVVTVWLALRANGQTRPLEELQQISGLLFGDVIQSDGLDEPEDPMRDPGRPLPATNGKLDSIDGSGASVPSPATSAPTGVPD